MRGRIGLYLLLVASLLMASFASLVSPAPAIAATPATFTYTGTAQTWTVPIGFAHARVDVQGAGVGGKGGRLVCSLDLIPGETLWIFVGGAGTNLRGGFNGGGARSGSYGQGASGGGGASDIRRHGQALSNRVVVAGGGGGGGSNSPEGSGGAGGGLTAGNGGSVRATRYVNASTGGRGASQSGGGGAGSPGGAGAGSYGNGGVGGSGGGHPNPVKGGGGGGGYYGGGGGGAAYNSGSGGGGGSSFAGGCSANAPGTSVVHTPGLRIGNGVVVITQEPQGDEISPTERLGANPHVNMVCPGGGDADPVQTATGNLWKAYADVVVGGRGPALVFGRTYNSFAAGLDGPLGWGWSFTYGMRLIPEESQVTVLAEEGSQVVFRRDQSGAFVAPAHHLSSLVRNPDGTWRLTRRARELFDFNSDGSLGAIGDLNGYRTTLTYQGGRLSRVVDSAGRALTIIWAGSRIDAISDSATPPRRIDFNYDGAGHLVEVVDVVNGRHRFGYDPSHRMTSVRQPRWADDTTTTPAPEVTFRYDGFGRVDQVRDPLGRSSTFDYSSIPRTTKVTDAEGNAATYAHAGQLLEAKTLGFGTPDARTWAFRYETPSLGCTSVTDPAGETWRATFDPAGNQTATQDPTGREWIFTHDGLNNLRTARDPSGVTTTYEYAGPNLRRRQRPLLSSSGAVVATQTIEVHYDDVSHPGDITRVLDPVGATWEYGYDPYGYVTNMVDPKGRRTTWSYDDVGRQRSVTTPRGNASGATPQDFTTRYSYDAANRLLEVLNPLGHRSERAYDPNS
ncbi:MAG: glycine-rich protein, partial [Acidimicrobiales bacterium]